MKKFLAILLSMVMVMSLAACGSGSAAEYYSGEVDWVEAGYEGDCIITNHVGLVLNGDGTYTLEDAFLVNQVSGAIVFYTKTSAAALTLNNNLRLTEDEIPVEEELPAEEEVTVKKTTRKK